MVFMQDGKIDSTSAVAEEQMNTEGKKKKRVTESIQS